MTEDDTVTHDYEDRDDVIKCRICLCVQGEADELGSFLSPCSCTGSMQYIHSECLNRWRRASTDALLRCNICKGHWIGFRLPSWFEYIKKTLPGKFLEAPKTLFNLIYIEQSQDRSFYCILRLLTSYLLFKLAVIQGRILILLVGTLIMILLWVDSEVDRMLLPEDWSSSFSKHIPKLSCFFNITHDQSINFTFILNSIKNVLEPKADDTVLGLLSIAINLFLVFRIFDLPEDEPYPEWLVPNIWEDVLSIMEDLIPEVSLLSYSIIIMLPGSIFFIRVMLYYCQILDGDSRPLDMITGEGLGFHLLLFSIFALIISALSGFLDWIQDDYLLYCTKVTEQLDTSAMDRVEVPATHPNQN